eukprot:TRINITY_DN55242_c0_g1_i1.p1 TRINITY_DN55242_c0_g1~~TRINITY_DN55242_c0_g1_i1.p1  ORF type:complete len:247 (+),score=51.59 TRINITY_DN55242_c0_g1_i1:47-787(+)
MAALLAPPLLPEANGGLATYRSHGPLDGGIVGAAGSGDRDRGGHGPRSGAALLRDLSESLATGQERMPDALIAHHLRRAGCSLAEDGSGGGGNIGQNGDSTFADSHCVRFVARHATVIARRLISAAAAAPPIVEPKTSSSRTDPTVGVTAEAPRKKRGRSGISACLAAGLAATAAAANAATGGGGGESIAAGVADGMQAKRSRILRAAPVLEALGAPRHVAAALAPPAGVHMQLSDANLEVMMVEC